MLHIHFFDTLTLFNDGELIHFSPLPKTYSLLAYLLLHRDQPIFRERLAALLWDDVLDEEARTNLRRHLHNLNKWLPVAQQPWLLTTNKQVQWNPDAKYWLDVAAFETAVNDPTRLEDAAVLYTGDLLPNLYDDWLTTERMRLKELYLQVLTTLTQHHQENREFSQALQVLQQLLQVDPLQETAVYTSMQLLFHQMRDRTGALTLYHQFQERLSQELDVLPLAATTALYNEIAKTQPQAAAKLATPAHNLPASINSFIGRKQELDAICAQLQNGVRLITITGTAGSGKTRFSLAAAHRLLAQPDSRWKDGIYFVALASLTQAEQVAEAIVEAMGIDSQSDRSPTDSLTAVLHPQHCLLILDNFEHLLPAATWVHQLLTAAPGLQILVSSQVPLQIYGEHQFPLLPLPLPAIKANEAMTGNALASNDAAILFVDRLRAIQPSFALTDQIAPTIAAICHQLDGIPLALELAAGRSKHFSLPTLLAQLDNRLNVLTGKRRNAPARQQTLRAAIDWSYQLLSAAEQQLFNQLTLFADTVSFEAANAVSSLADETAVTDLLFSLIERNMVQFVSTSSDEPRRISILGVLREYGRECLHKNRQEAAKSEQRLAHYYIDKVETAEVEMYGQDQAVWLDWMRWEMPNLTAVYDTLFANAGGEDENAARLLVRFATGMERVWQFLSRPIVGQQKLEQTLVYRHLLSVSEQIRLLNKVGGMAQTSDNFDTAVKYHQEALQLAYRTENETAVAHTLNHLGTAAGMQGLYNKARQFLEQSLALHRTVPDIRLDHLGALLNNLSIVYKRLGKYAKAEGVLKEVMSISRENNDQIGIASGLSILGSLALEQANLSQAKAYLQESLHLNLLIDNKLKVISPLHHLAVLSGQEERWRDAVVLFAACATLREQFGIGMSADFQVDYDRAMEQIEAHLDKDEVAACREMGGGMSMETAVQFALKNES